MRAIVTIPPHADFLAEVAAHPMTVGLRLNTVMPIAVPHEVILRRLAALGPPLWVDLKGRQLRVVQAAMPPFTALQVSHRVEVGLPADLYLNDGREHARVIAIDGDRLILDRSPRRMIGPGESVNIVAPDLTGIAATTDQSGGWATLRLTGPAGAAALARLVPVDLSAAAFPLGHAARAPLGHMQAVLMRPAADVVEVMVFRSMARTAWHEIEVALRALAARAALA